MESKIIKRAIQDSDLGKTKGGHIVIWPLIVFPTGVYSITHAVT